ncbi:MAG: ATP-dependent Clp protease proteolytic subunit [Clostridia bacterium]|nr:ATP-dependent Clp protease proteolytic subunit [Clostridia bacterium]
MLNQSLDEGKSVAKLPDKSSLANGSIITQEDDFCIYTMTIIGQVEGHYVLPPEQKSTKYEHLIPLLVGAEESKEIDGMLIILNTVGGDVEAGLAIAEMIASMSIPTVSLVLGGGHSIGIPLAVCAERSFIVPSATMTIHPVRMNGLVINAPQSFDYFNRMQNRIIDFITSHSGISCDRLRFMMMNTDEMATDIGSIIDGKTAVCEKLIDKIGGLSDALSELKLLIKQRRSKS